MANRALQPTQGLDCKVETYLHPLLNIRWVFDEMRQKRRMVFVFVPSITLGRFIFLAFSSILEQMLLRSRYPSCVNISTIEYMAIEPQFTLLTSLAYFAAVLASFGALVKQITEQGEVSATNANGLLSLG
jgi:hypothetical protein